MSPQTSRTEKEYLFIDGGCLRAATATLSEAITGSSTTLSVLYPALAGEADKIFYYDAISAQGYNELVSEYENRIQAEHDNFDKIRAFDRFHVSLGEVKGKGKNRRQKQVDVRLAVDMLTHTFRGNMQRAVLFAADDDFIPLVEALVREGMAVTVWHSAQATDALLNAADNRRLFDINLAHMLVTRDGVTLLSSFAARVGDNIILTKTVSFIAGSIPLTNIAITGILRIWWCGEQQTRYIGNMFGFALQVVLWSKLSMFLKL